MTLYHFTGSQFIESIKKEGLTKGAVPLISSTGIIQMQKGVQWLTSDENFDNQDWQKTQVMIKYARNDYRITVKLPKDNKHIFRWVDLCKDDKYKISAKYLNAMGNPENWYVYFGNIKRKWLTGFVKNEL